MSFKGELELTLRQVSIKTSSKETVNDGECFLVQMKNLVDGTQVEEEIKEDEGVLVFPENVLEKRVQQTEEGLITEVLIKWLGKDEGETTWASLEDIMYGFP